MKKKLTLKSLEVKSFVTNLDVKNKKTVNGGSYGCIPDTEAGCSYGCYTDTVSENPCNTGLSDCCNGSAKNDCAPSRFCGGGDFNNSINAGCTDNC